MLGSFITFEGTEGAGKTTQITYLHEYLVAKGYPVIHVHEPGGTQIGSRIRSLLLDPDIHDPFAIKTELFLYAASRAQLIQQVICPALEQGKIVLCDRFIDSTVAYQAYGAGISLDDVNQINQIATNGLTPRRTYLLDLPTFLFEERLALRGKGKDRMEQKDRTFHERVRIGYLALAEQYPERIKVLDATKGKESVFEEISQDFRSYC